MTLWLICRSNPQAVEGKLLYWHVTLYYMFQSCCLYLGRKCADSCALQRCSACVVSPSVGHVSTSQCFFLKLSWPKKPCSRVSQISNRLTFVLEGLVVASRPCCLTGHGGACLVMSPSPPPSSLLLMVLRVDTDTNFFSHAAWGKRTREPLGEELRELKGEPRPSGISKGERSGSSSIGDFWGVDRKRGHSIATNKPDVGVIGRGEGLEAVWVWAWEWAVWVRAGALDRGVWVQAHALDRGDRLASDSKCLTYPTFQWLKWLFERTIPSLNPASSV